MLKAGNTQRRSSMATEIQLFGSDLRLLGNLEFQSERDRGTDLAIVARPSRGIETPVDLDTVAGRLNLQQALLLRFLTLRGELTILGHPDYGSRLPELIGQLNNEANRNRAKLYALEALAGEPRVEKVLSIAATQNPGDRTRIDVTMSLRIIQSETPLNLVVPVFTGGVP